MVVAYLHSIGSQSLPAALSWLVRDCVLLVYKLPFGSACMHSPCCYTKLQMIDCSDTVQSSLIRFDMNMAPAKIMAVFFSRGAFGACDRHSILHALDDYRVGKIEVYSHSTRLTGTVAVASISELN